MEAIRIKGGHRFRVKHGPATDCAAAPAPTTVGVAPRGYSGLKPKLVVKEGDSVKRGDKLFFDKKNENIVFTAPRAGKVKEIHFGPRRRLDAVVLDELGDDAVDFGSSDRGEIAGLGQQKVVEKLVASGLWTRLLAFPGWGVAPVPGWVPKADKHGHVATPPKLRAVYVSALATEPHLPDAKVSLKGNEELFAAGLEALKQLAPKTWLFSAAGDKLPGDAVSVTGVQLRVIDAKFPAENVAVQLWYTERLSKGEVAATASIEDVIDIGHLFLKGTLRTERTYTVAGSGAPEKKHFKAAQGANVKELLGGKAFDDETRFIAGGLFTGKKVGHDDYLGPLDRALHVMPEDHVREPFHFQLPGLQKFSLLRTWLSGFMKSSFEGEVTTSNNGEERACVQCGACIDICPVELMPNLVFKAALAQDIEKMEATGIHDCADCGLCTFICPSKIELGQHIEEGKSLIAKEG
jgi:Na+-transporting NADH:ubiquinone oxidoreductase subunit A